MKKRELLEILGDWNFWQNEPETGKPRPEYSEKCLKFLDTNVVATVLGVRRAGKSFIMRQTAKKLIGGGVAPKNILLVNFEDRRFAEYYLNLMDEIYEAYLETLKPDVKPYIFLDEVHNVPKWERWVRTIHELGKANLLVSGSSSKLLSGELATLLTGRHLDLTVFPLSLREFLQFKGLEVKGELDLASKRIELKRLFSEYSEFGGFPEVVLSQDKKQLLLTYFDDILTRDIEKRYKLNKGEKLRALARFYLTNISSHITFNSLRKSLDTTTNTIEKFTAYLEEAKLIFLIKRFSFKVKEHEKAPRKVYSIDVGIANAVGFRFSSNFGKLMENQVAIELKRKQSKDPNLEIFYYHSTKQEEVDFVVMEGMKVRRLIQVCYDTSDHETKKREARVLITASKELNCNNLLIITENYEAEETLSWFGTKRKIKFVPLWKWLLKDKK